MRFRRICILYPSCASYTYATFQRQSLPVALGRSIGHLLKCNPFYRGPRIIVPAKARDGQDFVLKPGRYKYTILKK